ncbi:MAG: methylenetetrahydrofolate reductase [NAD(P)H] [Myxococcota bacterium]
MRITEALDSGFPTFSFEFFPPKTKDGEEKLWNTLRELHELKPTYVSVTYGAGGSTRTKTVQLTRRIKDELGLEPVAHLTCVGANQKELSGVLDELQAGHIENILPLRGDPPKGMDRFQAVEGGFRYASELAGFIKQNYDFCLGGACYPEGHLEAASLYADMHSLKAKVDAGAEFLVTQLFFDNRLYFDFVDRARAAGIDVPIVAGLMPITNVEQIKRFTAMCGASIPAVLLKELEKRADQPGSVMELGIAHATIQALGLIQGGCPGIHFYTLNKSTATREILTAIRMQARV